MPARPVVLVVDDHPAVAGLLRELLTAEGYAVECAATVEGALARIARQPVQLVLLDLKLSGADGLELCQKVRETEQSHHLPIIVLSAALPSRWEYASRAAGADDFVAKPFDIDHLLGRIRDLLSERALMTA